MSINKGSIESSRPSKTTSEAGLKVYDVSRNRGDETNPILDSLAEQTAGKLVKSGTALYGKYHNPLLWQFNRL